MECCAVIAAVGIVGTAICLAAADDSSYSTHNYYTTTPVYTKPSNYYIPPVIEIEIQQYENTKPIYPYPSSKPSLMTSLNGSHYYDYDYLLNSSSSYYDKEDIFNSKYDRPIHPSYNTNSGTLYGNAFSDLPVYPYPSSKPSLLTSYNDTYYN